MTNVSSLVALKTTVSILVLIVLIATKLSFRNEVSLVEIQRGRQRNVDERMFGKFAFPPLSKIVRSWLVASVFSVDEFRYFATYHTMHLVLHSSVIPSRTLNQQITHKNELRGTRSNSRRLQAGPPVFVISGSVQSNAGSTPSFGSATSTSSSGGFVTANGAPGVEVFMTSTSSQTDTTEPSNSYDYNVTIDSDGDGDLQRLPITITMTGPDDVDPDADPDSATESVPYTLTITGNNPFLIEEYAPLPPSSDPPSSNAMLSLLFPVLYRLPIDPVDPVDGGGDSAEPPDGDAPVPVGDGDGDPVVLAVPIGEGDGDGDPAEPLPVGDGDGDGDPAEPAEPLPVGDGGADDSDLDEFNAIFRQGAN
jgi:hypothetical protein